MPFDQFRCNRPSVIFHEAVEIGRFSRLLPCGQKFADKRGGIPCRDRSDVGSKSRLPLRHATAELHRVVGNQSAVHTPGGAGESDIAHRVATAGIRAAADVDRQITQVFQLQPAAGEFLSNGFGQSA